MVGKYLAVGNLFGGKVYQVSISASKATVVGTTHLAASKDIQQFWIDKDRIINAVKRLTSLVFGRIQLEVPL